MVPLLTYPRLKKYFFSLIKMSTGGPSKEGAGISCPLPAPPLPHKKNFNAVEVILSILPPTHDITAVEFHSSFLWIAPANCAIVKPTKLHCLHTFNLSSKGTAPVSYKPVCSLALRAAGKRQTRSPVRSRKWIPGSSPPPPRGSAGSLLRGKSWRWLTHSRHSRLIA